MHPHVSLASFVAAGLLTAPATSQLSQSSQLAGWTTQSLTAAGEIHIQDIDNSCAAARPHCKGVLSGNAQFSGGGTAYDPRHEWLWVTDGSVIEVRSLLKCTAMCTFKAQLMDSTAVVSGLAIGVAQQRLYQLETKPGYVGLRSYDMTKCPPTPLRDGCTLTIQSNATAGGLAYDEVRELLYFTESFPAFVGYLSNLHVAPANNKCKSQKFPMQGCQQGAQGWGPVNGVAYNPCSMRLYATDGQRTAVVLMTNPATGGITHLSCCDKQLAGDFRGLTVVPGWIHRTSGASCLPKGCPFCSSMSFRLAGGAPSLGNTDFGFVIENGPGGSFTFAVLGGPCSGGLPLPVLCGPLYVPLTPPPIVSPAVQLSGSACSGVASLNLPIPVQKAICGARLCAQWIVICGPILGVTEAIEFTIAG